MLSSPPVKSSRQPVHKGPALPEERSMPRCGNGAIILGDEAEGSCQPREGTRAWGMHRSGAPATIRC